MKVIYCTMRTVSSAAVRIACQHELATVAARLNSPAASEVNGQRDQKTITAMPITNRTRSGLIVSAAPSVHSGNDTGNILTPEPQSSQSCNGA